MDKIKNVSVVVFLFLFLASVVFNVYNVVSDRDVVPSERKVVVTVRDTIRDTVLSMRRDTVVHVVRDTLELVEVVRDSSSVVRVVAEVPISQREYSDDSTYTAWVSGYKPSLDSISVYRRTVHVNRDIVRSVPDRRRFGIGPVVYGGFGACGRRFDYGIGIGVSYHVFEW